MPSDEAGVRRQPWYHTIEFPDGSTTTGFFDTRAVTHLVPWPERLLGARCLDLGTCDGFWAFEMERRGAGEVIGIDVDARDPFDQSWEARHSPPLPQRAGQPTVAERFETARRALNSRARRITCSIYDLSPEIHGRFDVVFCGKLLIHLRDPVGGLERIARVCAGELVMLECVDALLDVMAGTVACAEFCPVTGQWWRFNRKGLREALRFAGFDVVAMSRPFIAPFGAAVGLSSSGWRRALRRHLARSPASPVLCRAAGLKRGTYDVALRARPIRAIVDLTAAPSLSTETRPYSSSAGII